MNQVLLYGPPLAGKATLLREFARRNGRSVGSFPVPFDDEECVQDRGLSVVMDAPTMNMVTISGGVWNVRAWRGMISASSALLLVLDPQPPRWDADKRCIAELLRTPFPAQIAIVFPKADLADAAGCELAIGDMLPPAAAQWPRFRASTATPTTLHPPLAWAVRACGAQGAQEQSERADRVLQAKQKRSPEGD